LAFIPGSSSVHRQDLMTLPVMGQDVGPRPLQASVELEGEGWCDSLHGQELDPMASHGSLGTTTQL